MPDQTFAELIALPLDKERRDTIIERVIQQEIDVNSGENDWFLRETLARGFKGYDNFSDEELVAEAILCLSEDEGEENEDDEDEGPTSGEEDGPE